jgi:16S rRNA (cytosine967-C5)-methyltransferase
MIAPARAAAFDILRAVDGGRSDLAAAVASARQQLADPRDRALAADIAAGVQRWRNALDHVVAAAARRPTGRLDPEILTILRLGTYQLLHLTRVPASAVVDDAVDLARRARKRSASGFVNAVLRQVSRTRRGLPLPPRPVDARRDRKAALRYLSITLSHPEWLAERWLDRVGFDAAEAWMSFDNAPAPLTLRPRPFKATGAQLLAALERAGITARPGRFASSALILDPGASLAHVASDLYLVQDEASQIVPLLAGPVTGRVVLDTCASPGGKTVVLAEAAGAEGRVVAIDVRARRIALLRQTVAACGAPNVSILQADLLSPLPLRRGFDCVFVDAPCSGLGTLRRDPDIRWRREAADLTRLSASQVRMLTNAAGAVAVGGRLVYATCSSEPEENDAVVDAFLTAHPGFHELDASRHSRVPAALVDGRGRLRTTPFAHGLEAFFGAVLERRAGPEL